MQIAEQFEALGAGIHVRCAALVGGIDMMAQAIALGKGVHVIVGTPGRVVDHLSNTKARIGTRLTPLVSCGFQTYELLFPAVHNRKVPAVQKPCSPTTSRALCTLHHVHAQKEFVPESESTCSTTRPKP